MSENEESQISSPSQKFEPQEGDEEALWEVIEITGEKAGYYKVRWDGIDPKTMKPWPLSWVPKRDCTDDLVMIWKQKQKGKERRKSSKKRDSTASKRSKARESTTSTTTKSRASTIKPRSLRSESIATVTGGKTRASGSILAVPEEEEESSPVAPAVVEPKNTISKSKKPGNKRKHAEVSSTHTSANVAVVDVDPEEQGGLLQRKTIPPAKKRKLAQSSPLKPKVISPLAPSKTSKKAEPQRVARPGATMATGPRLNFPATMTAEDRDEAEERSVEHALSSPGIPSDRGDVEPVNGNGDSGVAASSPANGHRSPKPSKKSLNKIRPSEESHSEYVQPPSAKSTSLPRKNDSKSSILEGRKRTLTKKRPPTVASDSDEPQGHRAFLRTSSEGRDHRTPVEEASVFWDGEEREARAVLSPRSNRRLSIFDRELREAEEEMELLQQAASKLDSRLNKAANKPNNNSQDVVPETEFSSQSIEMQVPPDISPVNSPPATPPPAKGANTLKSKMQGRTPLSKHSSLNNVPAAGPSRKVLRPIPMLDAEVFHPYLQNSIPETIEEDNSQPRKGHKPALDNDEAPLSSIEQFDTPQKSKAKVKQPVIQLDRIPAKDKGKKKAVSVSKEPSASEIWESEVVQRGQQIAAAAKRKEREQELAVDAGSVLVGAASKAKRRTLLDIAHAKSRPQPLPPAPTPIQVIEQADEVNAQMDDVSTDPVAPSSHPPPPTAPETDHQLSLDVMHEFIDFHEDDEPHAPTIDPKFLRQEEEETSQDIMEHMLHTNGKQVEERLDSMSLPRQNSVGPSQEAENSQSQKDSHIPHPSPVPQSMSHSLLQHSPAGDQRDKASIPQESEDIIPMSQDNSQHYGMSESLPHPMELDEAGLSGLGVQLSQETPASHVQWANERSEWQIEQMSLRAEIEALRLNLKGAEKDREFFRDQYTRASAFVSDTVAENKQLKQRADIADGQVKDGVKFVREMYEARTQMLEDDIKHWRNTAQFMIEKDRMTNDDVRKRAAEEPEVRKKLAEEKENVFMRDKRIYDLENEGQARNARISELEKEASQWKTRAEALSRELDEAKHKLERLGKEGHEDDEGDGHELVYPCAWRTDGVAESCQATFTSLPEFHQHVNTHLPSSS